VPYSIRVHSEADAEHARTIAWLTEHVSAHHAIAYQGTGSRRDDRGVLAHASSPGVLAPAGQVIDPIERQELVHAGDLRITARLSQLCDQIDQLSVPQYGT
jgi:hypothetical protein